jgi:hypothetical protein
MGKFEVSFFVRLSVSRKSSQAAKSITQSADATRYLIVVFITLQRLKVDV